MNSDQPYEHPKTRNYNNIELRNMDPNSQDNEHNLDQLQQQQQQQYQQQWEQNNLCFGGLLNRNDRWYINALKLIFAIPLLPFVILYRLTLELYHGFIYFCQNQCYNCLVWTNAKVEIIAIFIIDKLVRCYEALCSCWSYIWDKIYFVLSILGRCSLRVVEALSRFTFELILKIAHFRSLILELSSAIMVPITLGCLVPFYMFCYNYIFLPIRCVIRKGLEYLWIGIKQICKFIWIQIIVNIYRIIRFIVVSIIFRGIELFVTHIVQNIYRIVEWIIINFYEYIIYRFLYKLIIYPIYLVLKYILCDIIYELFLVNLWKLFRYIIEDIIYDIILVNLYNILSYTLTDIIYPYLILPLYHVVKFIIVTVIYQSILIPLYKISKWVIIDILYEQIIMGIYNYILVPIYRVTKYVLEKIYNFLVYGIMLPIWNGIIKLGQQLNIYIISPLFRLIRQLGQLVIQFSSAIWNAVKHCFSR